MEKIYSHPKKVLLLLFFLTAVGIACFTKLPVSLYPNSSKPEFTVRIGLEGQTPRDFLNQYGPTIKGILNKIEGLDELQVRANKSNVRFRLKFDWGLDLKEVETDVQTAVSSIKGFLPFEIQRKVGHWMRRQGSGFLSISFYDDTGDLSNLQKKLYPILIPQIRSLKGIEEANLWDPNSKNLYITLDPKKIAQYRLSVAKINNFLRGTLKEWNAGTLQIDDTVYSVSVHNKVKNFESLSNLSLKSLGRNGLKLSDIARVEMAPKTEGNQVMRTNGKQSLILFVRPDSEGNLKETCEKVISIVNEKADAYPTGTKFSVLVNPSTFVKSAIYNVKKDIFLGGLFAVLTLLLFVGSLRASIFSSIEIPLAIVWAFILMYTFDVSINLISLGGLALTAGMNIDASIVMVENILRHFKLTPPKNKSEQLQTVIRAAREVFIPILSSTFSTVIVFLPLSATSGITYAILGDLAKAVVFSHIFSLVVALLLVPTIRAHINIDEKPTARFLVLFQRGFERVSYLYQSLLSTLIENKKVRFIFFTVFIGIFVSSIAYFAPKVRKQIVAMPNTDAIWINVNMEGIKTTGQFSQRIRPVEYSIINNASQYVKHVFSNIWSANNGGILVKLHDKDMMDDALKKVRELLPKTPDMRLSAWPWNPSRLPIPNPPDLRIELTGPPTQRIELTQKMMMELRGSKKFGYTHDTLREGSEVILRPKFQYIDNLKKTGGPDINEIGTHLRTMLSGQLVGYMSTDDGAKEIQVRFPAELVQSIDDLNATPIQAGNWLLPLNALVDIRNEKYTMALYERDGRELTSIRTFVKGEYDKQKKSLIAEYTEKFKNLVSESDLAMIITTGDKEVMENLQGLLWAVLISFCLIGFILYLQFESLKYVAIVMSSIPLGIFGVTLSLYTFDSTWSINSLLGVIMLGGISVNNSILLVSFFKQRLESGQNKVHAALESAKLRLRPILVTSFTTIFAMSPIAFGFGEGAEVLQPLGIAVSGGMFFSTLFTLIIIPILEVSFVKEPTIKTA